MLWPSSISMLRPRESLQWWNSPQWSTVAAGSSCPEDAGEHSWTGIDEHSELLYHLSNLNHQPTADSLPILPDSAYQPIQLPDALVVRLMKMTGDSKLGLMNHFGQSFL